LLRKWAYAHFLRYSQSAWIPLFCTPYFDDSINKFGVRCDRASLEDSIHTPPSRHGADAVIRDGGVFPAAALIADLVNPVKIERQGTMTPRDLTQTEISYLTFVAHGLGLTAIGKAARATETEVETLLLGVQRKLGARNRMQAVAMALSLGMIAAIP
jgi:DNA-binding CsgD family transcriptional regulator